MSGFPEERGVLFGMSFGYADPDALNQARTTREDLIRLTYSFFNPHCAWHNTAFFMRSFEAKLCCQNSAQCAGLCVCIVLIC